MRRRKNALKPVPAEPARCSITPKPTPNSSAKHERALPCSSTRSDTPTTMSAGPARAMMVSPMNIITIDTTFMTMTPNRANARSVSTRATRPLSGNGPAGLSSRVGAAMVLIGLRRNLAKKL